MALPCPEMSIVFFAAVRAGAIFVPLDPRLSKADLSAVLQDSEPRLIFASSDRYELLNELGVSDRLITIDNSG
ncbi:AMP-binding protein, partial [Acinetobacter baumannii]